MADIPVNMSFGDYPNGDGSMSMFSSIDISEHCPLCFAHVDIPSLIVDNGGGFQRIHFVCMLKAEQQNIKQYLLDQTKDALTQIRDIALPKEEENSSG